MTPTRTRRPWHRWTVEVGVDPLLGAMHPTPPPTDRYYFTLGARARAFAVLLHAANHRHGSILTITYRRL